MVSELTIFVARLFFIGILSYVMVKLSIKSFGENLALYRKIKELYEEEQEREKRDE